MRQAGIRFSEIEIIDLLKAWLATSIAFGIFFMAGEFGKASFSAFLFVIAIAAVTAGLGFIGHELMHKFTSNHFGVHAEFRSNDTMLVVAILLAFFGLIFAAPGAVQIYSHVTRRENGIISAAGPAMNMVLALIFLPLAVLASPNTIFSAIGSYGLLINALLGIFNMIPVWGFDGEKVLAWNKTVYFSMMLFGGILVVGAVMLSTQTFF